MNVIAKNVTAAAAFDESAWREELLALNPWARGLTTTDRDNEAFAAARQRATLVRHAQGKEAWNAWAGRMLALKSALDVAGQWATKRDSPWTPWTGVIARAPWAGENEATRAWLTLACAGFSTEAVPHQFTGAVSFTEYTFSGEASFGRATFSGDAGFGRATFSGDASFDGATFSGDAGFEGVTFSGDAGFGCAAFSRDANFGRATFSRAASFDSATFSGDVGFRRATFLRDASFGSATFSGNAWFGDAAFSIDAWFDRTIFSGDARFGRAVFEAATYFNEVRFNAGVEFAEAKLKGAITFANSRFGQRANFEAIDSAAAFSLADAKFEQVPGFIGATFKGTLRLDNVGTPRYRLLGYTPDKDATARFRELRRRAGEAQDRDRELEFFAQEVRTGRFHAKGLPSWVPKAWSWRFWFGLGFGALSDFGRSLWRPLLWWLALTAVCAAFFLGEHEEVRKARTALDSRRPASTATTYAATTRDAWANPPACRFAGREPFTSTDAVTEAIQLSLRNALVFDIGRSDSARRTYGCLFGLDEGGNQDYLRVSARVSMASTLQALASGLLIFLFLLAVRNLLRLG